ncbi:MAG TPA: hypothetical protein VG538_09855 [Vicinamibacterales bacterium]|jgi:hypothetical protein|nr:hypothetical protein [Vicinamibacterales bacterium]
MAASTCSSIKDELLKFFTAHASVVTRGSMCVLTLPVRTIDGRFVEVFVEEKLGDAVLVHDAGKTAGELHVQGLHWTTARRDLLRRVAERLGVTLDDRGVFQKACKRAAVSEAVLTISQCASVGMFEVVQHAPRIEEEPIAAQVKRVMSSWKPGFLDVVSNVRVSGRNGDHAFDAVAHHKDAKHRTVAIKTLPYGYGAHVQADRYGFMVLDLKVTPFDKWQRLAVISQVERWPAAPLKLVRKLSADTLELRTGEEQFRAPILLDAVQTLSAKATRKKTA